MIVAPAGQTPVCDDDAVGALDVLRILQVVEEAVGRAEDVAAVGKAEERLHRVHAVELQAGLDVVRAAQEADVVVELHARVVILDRDEERLAEAVALGEVEGRVGQRPALAGDVRSVVGARPVFFRELEAELVEQRRLQRRSQAADDSVRRVFLDGVCAASPRVDVERAVDLLRPGVVVAEVGDVLGTRR